MMWCRIAIGAMLVALMTTQAEADSIVIDGRLYTNVKIFETAKRYYVRLESAESMTIEKSALKPGEVVFGDATIAKSFVEEVPDSAVQPEIIAVQPEITAAQPETPSALPVEAKEPEVEVPKIEHPRVDTTPAPIPPPTPAPIPPPTRDLPKPPPSPNIARAPVGPLYAGAARVLIGDAASSPTREANALVLRSGDIFVAFCAVDQTFVRRAVLEGTIEELKRMGSAVTREALIVSATGIPTAGVSPSNWTTHAPGQSAREDTELLTKAIAQAVFQAEQDIAPAAFRAAEAEAPDYHKVRPGGSATPDSTLSVLRVEGLDGAPRAYLVNYAVYPYPHPETTATTARGIPGFLAEALRQQSDPDMPVLFLNGAAGDTIPKPPAGGDPEHLEESIGHALARAATAAVASAQRQETVALTRITSVVTLPNTLFSDDFPATTVLREVHLGDTVLLTFPAALAAQIGLLMRVKAFEQGAEQVFLLTHTGDFFGYHPTIEEFFAVTPQTRRAFFGPLMLKWYGDRHLESNGESATDPAWRNAPALGRYASSFTASIARGAKHRNLLNQEWRSSKGALERLCRVFFVESNELSHEANTVLADLATDKMPTVFQHFAALFIRERYATFTEEERAILMGIAEGANLPFDAILILQTLSNPSSMSDKAEALVQQLGLKGVDFFDSPVELADTL